MALLQNAPGKWFTPRMATTMRTVYFDDLTGEELPDSDVHTVQFGLDGVSYEIDLSPVNYKAMLDSIGPWAEHARRASSTTTTTRKRPSTESSRGTNIPAGMSRSEYRAMQAEVRAWGKANGMEVGDRGRIPDAVTAAWEARDKAPKAAPKPGKGKLPDPFVPTTAD